MIAYKPKNTRTTWAAHGEDGWYVGPAPEHYRCVSVYFPATRSVRVVDTVCYFPSFIPFPKVSLEDHLRQASSDIVSILLKPPSQVTPDLESGDAVKNALLTLANIFKTAEEIPSLPSIKTSSQQHIQPLPRVIQDNSSLKKKIKVPLPRVKNTPTLLEKLTQKKHERTMISPHRYMLRNKTKPYPSPYHPQAARTLLAQHIFSRPNALHIYNDEGKRLTIDKLVKGENSATWLQSLSMEFGRLAQGNKYGVQSTDTIDFISHTDVPIKEKVTYA